MEFLLWRIHGWGYLHRNPHIDHIRIYHLPGPPPPGLERARDFFRCHGRCSVCYCHVACIGPSAGGTGSQSGWSTWEAQDVLMGDFFVDCKSQWVFGVFRSMLCETRENDSGSWRFEGVSASIFLPNVAKIISFMVNWGPSIWTDMSPSHCTPHWQRVGDYAFIHAELHIKSISLT